MAIQIKTLDQLKLMRKAGLVVAQTLDLMRSAIVPGATTNDLNNIAIKNLAAHNAKSNFLNYHGFPAVICASINDEIVHGIPNDCPIVDGDVVDPSNRNRQLPALGDAAFSVIAGTKNPDDQKLLDTCEESMWRGIAAGKLGANLTDISFAIEDYIRSQGKYGILREYGGHGIGTEMHQEPHVLNFGAAGMGPELKPGIALAIEPMITRGSPKTKVLADEWTVVSQDGTRGAHFEHSFAILEDGKPFVLTATDGGREKLGSLGIEISNLL